MIDTNGDGSLDFDELKPFLMEGNPTFTTDQVRTLYEKYDANRDGLVWFNEFSNYTAMVDKAECERQSRASGRDCEDPNDSALIGRAMKTMPTAVCPLLLAFVR